ncbi:surfactin non-ribosomal peptide synthetase SrfAA [Bacillus subtilis]|uniref:surfactin non-ribosomal peptide synthetase SrfAA n=4 Tax=Bacillus subtilis TaxID=1423 RepID=UPI002DB8DDEB|nr:surfactin non-ribosomal peptide synthetase SrfAA [Bacillus subtilis]MEC0439212.1 surfactin non-ribosomal peptide synthetase SrfAA [Bacillus subtilis]MEC1989525.1 surfactin non-ribosomal peptide synthetase SrfAA [Bacillus subtilis]
MEITFYPLTDAQKRIWYTEKFYPHTSISNLAGIGKLVSADAIDYVLVEQAIQEFIRRNDAMRLRLRLDENGEPVQYISEYRPVDIKHTDTTEDPNAIEFISQWSREETKKPLPLYDCDLFRFSLFTIKENEVWFYANVHHVISDGISMNILGNAIMHIYLELASGSEAKEGISHSFIDHVLSEQDYAQSKRFEKDKAFWNKQFESVPELVSLKRNASAGGSLDAERFSKDVPEALHQQILSFCEANKVSVLSVFQSLLAAYLYRVSGQNDVVTGTFMGNRTNAKEKQMLGMFVSTVPLRTNIDGGQAFLEFVKDRMKDLMKTLRHQKYPYNLLINDLRETKSSLTKLFTVSLEYQVMQWQKEEDLAFLTEPIFSGSGLNDVSIHVKDRWDTGKLTIDFDYRTDLFSREEINMICERMITMLENALTHPEHTIDELTMISDAEKEKLLARAGGKSVSYRKDMTIPELFQEKAEQLSDHPAVVFEDRTLSYRTLHEQSARIANVLKQKGVGPDSPVAVLIERSERMITAIMGILKAGGAYVPIDPGFPAERIQYILEDCGADFILTESKVAAPEADAELIDLDQAIAEGAEESLNADVNARNLAYIIYTSGTTGRPKGVMIEHRQVHHLVESLQQTIYQSGSQTLRMALLAPFHFDASVKQIFASLLLGQTLYIVPKKTVTNGAALAAYYRRNSIEATDGTPAHLQMLAAAGDFEGLKLKHMLIGGEGLSTVVADKLLKLFKEAGTAPRLTNVYGPTETCVDASVHPVIPENAVQSAYVPIGKALGNNRLYILDQKGRLQPEGVAGELYIAGDGVGRGYLHLPELTEEKFLQDPFVPGDRMYRTGDVVRWLPDGTIEYLGREDDQVKVRGYRIELGEIEAVIQQAPDVAKAVVLARPDEQGNLEVCAYVVQKPGSEFAPAGLREHAARQLPDYMVPAYFTEVTEIPLTPSGKVDRRKLFALEVKAVSGTAYTAPRNETEKAIAAIWQDVLNVEKAGIFDNFFETGGHSLKAMTLLTKIHKETGIEIPLQFLFEHPTITALAEEADHRESKAFAVIEPAEKQEHYPLSLAQQRTYIVSQFEDAGVGYNMPAAAILEGPLDIQKLERAFQGLIRRHESLRTSFVLENSTPRQKIHDSVDFNIEMIERGGRSDEAIMASFVRTFDLAKAPLFRIGLLGLEENRHMLLFDMHHLISDGVSIGIMLEELARIYKGEQLPDLRLQYKDYAVWQSRQAAEGYKKDQAYWKEVFAGELPVLQLLSDYPRPPVQSFEGDRVSIKLDAGVKDRLNRLAEQNGATLYMVMLSAYYTLLSKYTGQDDIIVGTPSAGRNHSDTEGIIGMFVNTLAIRSEVKQNETFTQLISRVRKRVLDAFSHQDYPFEWLVEDLNIPRDVSRHPLFDTMFSLQNATEGIPAVGDLSLSVQETNFKIAKFDLTVQARETDEGIELDLDYSTKLFKQSTADRLLTHFARLLEEAAVDSEKRISEYKLLSEEEAASQIQQFNPGRTPYPKDKTIVQLFEEQAANTPDHTALQYEGESLTYRELNERANRLARGILSLGAGEGRTAAVLCERSMDMIVSILAVLKSGSAYVPIDPEHPIQRMQHFFRDSGAKVLLTQRKLKALAEEAEFKGVIVLADEEESYHADARNLALPLDSEAMANLTYTSGTTGTPKGNIVTHANILRTVKETNYLSITEQDTILGLSNYVFDAFMFDMFGSLLNGAKLVLIPKETVLDMARLSRVIERENISILMITTALFHLLVDLNPACLSTLRKIMFGGERASVEHVRKALQTVGKGKLLHMYGPSESTVFATYHPVDELEEHTLSVPIGKPVSNTEVYILDRTGHVQPAGIAGELCVSGEGLVKGYYNRPELTEEKFVPHPFTSGERMYKTGDLARWLPNGDIEFIGRIDHQVKIRGQRIELGEIEHQLQTHDRVQESVVLAVDQGAGDKLLCAYCVGEGDISSQEMREHAAKDLPAYMVPAVFIQMDELPLTGNGKIDRRALPIPDANVSRGVSYVAPRNGTEQKVADIWAHVLQAEQVGVYDHFFDIGGHSLAGMKMLALVHQELGVELSLKDLFQSPTVEGLAQVIASAEKGTAASISPAEKQDTYPVSSPQKRMYVLQQLEDAQTSYNMPAVLRLTGELDVERLNSVMQQLMQRHEALRTTFEIKDGETVQRIWEEAECEIAYFEAPEEETERIVSEFIKPFKIDQLPLFRIGLIKHSDTEHVLLFDMHHIISDGASVGVLIEELSKLYDGETLEPLRIQYKDYAVWQQQFIQSELYKKQEEHWLKELDGELPVLTLPTDYSRPAVQTFEGDRIAFSLEAGKADALRRLAKETDSTLYMVLLASYSAFLSKLSGQDDIIVGSPVAGRSQADVSRVIGMFVNTLALRTYPKGEKTFANYLNEVKETALSAFDAQDYPLEDLIGNVQVQRDTSRNPLFDAVFSMQNANIKDLTMKGIQLEPHPFERKTAKFDLTLTADETDGGLTFVLEYNTALFKQETIERWKQYWMELLDAVTGNPNQPLSSLSLVTETEKQALLEAWKGKALPVPTDKTVHQLFEETAQRHKDRRAVTYNGQSWTYGELNAKANRLARILMDCGISPDDRVGILTKPSLEMSAAVLGVLKAGAAFVPIDPDYPDQRIEYILQDSGAKLLLKQEGISVPDSFSGDVILLDGSRTILSLPLDENDEENPETAVTAENLAYMIYTSGTTGQPKGVMVEHHALVNLCFWHHDAFSMTAEDRSAKYAGFGFDASIWEMFPTWTIGAELHVIDEAIRLDIVRLNDYFETNGVTITFLPTQLAEQFMELENTSLRVLLTGGDKLKRAVKKPYTLVNNYGPTENTVVATSAEIHPEEGSLSIGRAIANTRVYILGEGNQVQPEGVAGELCVAGRGLARGYLNREDETAKRFVADPFVPGERMYRTGDLVKWTGGGIEYIGRIDQQVKVRGYRIELSEIEVQLAQLSEVQDAAVTAVKDKGGNTAIAAYVTPETADIEALKSALKETLPDYMIPAFWVTLNELPVTANGKVDRKALPEPDIEAGSGEYKAPTTDMEELLAGIWQDVLGMPEVGVTDNFFSLGGDSIKGIQMASRLNQHGWKLEMKDLFQHPTIEELTQYVERAEGKQADQGPVEGEVILTPIQRWFFEKNFTNKHHWNQSVMLHAAKGFDPERVEKTLQALIEHHDALRMVYREENGDIVQAYKPIGESKVSFEIVDLYGSDEEMLRSQIKILANKLQSSLDLRTGPLLKAEQYRTEAGDHLLIAVHHLVVDGVSWRILLEDFASGYMQAEKEESLVFPQKTNSFKDWAEELAAFSQSAHLLQQAEYWSQIAAEQVSPLPKDCETEQRIVKDTSSVLCELTEEDTKHLLTDVHQPYGTEINDILLSALGLTMKEWTKGAKIGINLEGHGREDIIPNVNISRTVGWFTAQYPVVLDISDADASAVIKTVKENLRRIPDKGVGYGILRYFTETAETKGFTPEISFNYLGQFDSEVKTDFFEPSAFDMGRQVSGESEALYALSFSGMIRNGRFVLSCSYNEKEFERATIEERMERFKENLLMLIRHCTEKEDKEFTPSDFSAEDLEMDEMGDIFDMLEENLK